MKFHATSRFSSNLSTALNALGLALAPLAQSRSAAAGVCNRAAATGLAVAALLAGILATTANASPNAEIRIDAASLNHLPDGTEVDRGVSTVRTPDGEAIVFSGGGITVPTPNGLTADVGSLEATFRVGDEWDDRTRRTLIAIGEESAQHISISAERGRVIARYDSGDADPAVVLFHARRRSPDDPVSLRFSWKADGGTVLCWLVADGELTGLSRSAPIRGFPETVRIGFDDDGTAWDGTLGSITFSFAAVPPPELEPGERRLRVRADLPGGALHSFWHVANFALPESRTFTEPDAYDTLMGRAPFTTEVLVDYTFGGRFPDSDEWFLGVDDQGAPETDFAGMLKRIGNVIDAGLKPWIALEKVPPAMSDPPRWHAYGNTAPPADYDLWHAFVSEAISALVGRFGREAAGSWSYIVATEPDLHPHHWAGTREEFLKYMDYSMDAVTRVLPEAPISPGNILNPAFAHEYRDQWGTDEVARHVRARDQWGLDIIDHAATGTNAYTGHTGSRIDFFSASWYIRMGMSNDGFDRAVETMRTRLDRYPRFAGVPVDIREFGVLSDEQGRRLFAGETTEWSASFYASIARRVYDLGVRYIFEWDHATRGVLHPRGHVIGMLEQMTGGRRLPVEVEEAESNADCHAIAVRKDGRLLMLVFNHRPLRHARVPETVQLELVDPAMQAGDRWLLSEWTIDAERTVWARAFEADAREAGLERRPRAGAYEGNPARLYGEAGEALFFENIDRYRALAKLPQTKERLELIVEDGRAQIELEMPAHSVRLLELTPGGRPAD